MIPRTLRQTTLAIAVAQVFAVHGASAQDVATAAAPAEPEMSAIQSVIVQAQRTSNATARLAQKEAPNLVNLLTAEEMRKLPDVNIAESVRRVPGVSLETDTGEGRYVNIRGLDADLNSTTFGGLRLPPSNNASPFGGGRAVALDAIPSGLVGAITVTKTNLPEQDAEALGGTIEITPKTAPANSKPFFEGHIGTGREQLRGTGIADVSFSTGGRFGVGTPSEGLQSFADRPFSVVVTSAYYEDKRGVDDVEPAFLDDGVHSPSTYAGWDQRYYQYHRQRHGVGIDLGYQPSATSSYYMRAFDAGYTETVMRNRLTVTPDGDPVATATGFIDGVTANGFDKTLRQEKERIDNKVYMLGGKNSIDDKQLDYRVGFTRGSYDKLYDYNSDFNFTPSTGTVSYNSGGAGNTPRFSVAGADYLNPTNYTLAGFANSTTAIADKEWSLSANLKMPVAWGGFADESAKFGASARVRKRVVHGQPISYTDLPALPLAAASSGSNVTFYKGQYQNGPQLTEGLLQNALVGNQIFTTSDRTNAALQYQSDKEDVYAAYGQYQMTAGKLTVTGGVRAELTRATYGANSKGVNADGNDFVAPTTQDKTYRNFFPSVQGRYALTPATQVRAAYSSTIARPGFNQVNPSLNINPSSNMVVQGNPNLKPITANSFDLSIEHYLPNAGILSAGVFDKEISNYIAASVANQTFPKTGLFAGFVGVAHVASYANVGKARVTGMEMNYEQRFKQLPGAFSGLGAGLNYTYVNSSVNVRPGENSLLPSTSKNTANATVFYERKGLNLRIGKYYLSRNLFAIGGSSATDVYSESRSSVDFGSSYAVSDNLSVYFNAKNLSNTPLRFAEGTSGRTTQREFYGATYQLGLNFNY